MPANLVSMSDAYGQLPNVDDLCVAMFLEGARLLGIKDDAPMSLDAQAKILEAAASLGERLAVLLEIQGDHESAREPELGN
jgi:hypothetical protein